MAAQKQSREVFEICPRLVPLNQQQTCWEGLICVKGNELHLRIELPKDGDHRKARLFGDWSLNQHLRSYRHLIGQRLLNTPDLATFLSELKNILEHTMEHHSEASKAQPGVTMATRCSQVIHDVARLGWEKLSSIDSSFSSLQLICQGPGGSKHYITVHLDAQHPIVAPTCSTDLPGETFELLWTHQSTLADIYRQFEGSLAKYREFWDTVAEIDNQTWVLEPERPKPSDTSRRIALGNNSSIQVTVDPLYPRMLPEFKFLGADHVINPMREKLNANLKAWDPGRSLLSNLKALLDIHFPSPQSSRREDFNEECGICYSYRLEGAIPDRACDNPQCNKPFHYSCLYEWLCCLPTSHQTMSKFGFNTIFGKCPYCEEPVKIKRENNR
ncbi:E3 ubiquitin-protein ligase FANCL-like isoform X2 [Acanthaster planci]|nr:E3 ubiquitin-protein ligase FANCL-like isoform X2 [Acanthaster planci]XP_022093067.1 E3 ubiquitin-protein ligase FANCL-like isoform X2 [Acanthaster planci]XP_022093068.1 E3 ubiquitin-protein ligase FANCL-like isoform X2 [Acanthaster planci]XP_022093069.1 E3 ubiquitin-protein ligase FANCL-like isoform X2 [Acanthaster planci]XP_022093070.1 E3 ubiquitin-protein ligase FANCL-like isoform X2 [Acanthaster planci]XP_022093071.1 E3 ubiquitin-protein ligase FANCL-like isoform X2 [Acanthaster planci]